jgi:hypothetical protein
MPTDIDPNADVGLISDMLSERSGRETDAANRNLLGVQTQREEFLRDTDAPRFAMDMLGANSDFATDASTRETQKLQQALIRGNMQDAQRDRAHEAAVTQAENDLARMRTTYIDQAMAGMENNPNARTHAIANWQEHLAELTASGKISEALGISESVWHDTAPGAAALRVTEARQQSAGEALLEGGNTQWGMSAQEVGQKVEQFTKGTDNYLANIGFDQNGNAVFDPTGKHITQDEVEQILVKNKDSIGGEVFNENFDNRKASIKRQLAAFNKSTAEMIIKNAARLAEGNPEKFGGLVEDQISWYLQTMSTPETRQAMVNGVMPMSESKEALLVAQLEAGQANPQEAPKHPFTLGDWEEARAVPFLEAFNEAVSGSPNLPTLR